MTTTLYQIKSTARRDNNDGVFPPKMTQRNHTTASNRQHLINTIDDPHARVKPAKVAQPQGSATKPATSEDIKSAVSADDKQVFDSGAAVHSQIKETNLDKSDFKAVVPKNVTLGDETNQGMASTRRSMQINKNKSRRSSLASGANLQSDRHSSMASHANHNCNGI